MFPIQYDEKAQRIMYFKDSNRTWTEWDIRSHAWIKTLTVGKDSTRFFWRGLSLQDSTAEVDGAKRGLYLSNGANNKWLGAYKWVAESTNQKFALVKSLTDNTYWLLTFE